MPVFILSNCAPIDLGSMGSISLPSTAPASAEATAAAVKRGETQALKTAAKATKAVTQPRTRIVPTITGMGYASISSQPAKSINQRRLMAIRAARMEAMRNLTEQVHGIQINSRTTLIDQVIQNDTLRATVAGLILGAKTVRINPVGADTYEVVLELDQALVKTIMSAARG